MKTQLLIGVATAALTVLTASALENEGNLMANGSFEFWSRHGAERLQDMLKVGPAFESEDPLIPTRWTWRMQKPMGIRQSADAHTGKHAIAVASPAGGGGHLSLGRMEVAPGATYSFGVWAKGSGDVTVEVMGEAPEGLQPLGSARGQAAAPWTRIGGTVEIPRHIRLAWLQIWAGAPCDMALDDAYLSAPLDQPFNADDVLAKKYDRDDDTLLLMDFEKDDPNLKLEEKVQITKADGGRFGRGLRLDGGHMRGGLATVPFRLPAMPKEGTIEFWLSTDEMPNISPKTWDKPGQYLQVNGAAGELCSIGAFSDSSVTCGWRIDNETYGKRNSVSTSSDISAWRMHKGEWHHYAVTWDRSAWRFYVDGVLSGMTTKPPLGWWDAPVSISIGSVYNHSSWDGVIDEIRISKVLRFGPITPKGVKPNPLPIPEEPRDVKPKEPPKPKDFGPERAKLLGSIPPTQAGAFEAAPNPAGEYVYEATSAKPLVDGVEVKVQPDNPIKGLTTAVVNRPVLLGLPNLGGMYWRMGGIKAGRYWIGVVLRCGADAQGVELPQWNIGNFDVYLNGRVVQCSTFSDPVQVAPGAWFAMVQAAVAESVKEGDEIYVVGNCGIRLEVARLVLLPKEPARGPHRARMNPGPNTWNQDTCLGLNAETSFMPAAGKQISGCMADSYYGPEQWIESTDDLARGSDGKPQAKCLLFNPLPVPVEVDYECVVKGYYLQVAGRDAARLTLAPHSTVTRNISFDATADDPSYFMTTTIKAIKKPDLGWPAYDELEFFPGLRHMVPWTDPFNYTFHRRLCVKQVMTGPRPVLALHGAWEASFTRDLKPVVPPPADAKFAPVTIPPQWGRLEGFTDPKCNAVYIRRKFTLTEDQAKRVAQMGVGSVSSEGTLYVNGKEIGNIRGYGTPLVGDATKALKAGENEVLLVIRNKLAITNPQYVNADNPTESAQYMDAPGDCNASLSMGGGFCAMGGGVWLDLMPEVHSCDVKVDTSVRKGAVAARFRVVNGSKQEARLKVRVSVEDARQPLFALGERELTLPAGESKEVIFSKEWRNPRLWNWRQPNLYVLAVEISDAATGRRLDLARERFGFRETWVQGDRIVFNGTPVRLNGVGTAPSISMRCEVQLGRGSLCVDYNDETGDPITVLVSGLVNTPSKYNVASDRFWATTRDNALVAVKRAWNHPSIIAWDLSNEWYTYAPYTGADMTLAGKRFMGLSAAVERLDPSRWTFCNGDYDIGGLHYVLSSHYMLEAAGRDPRSGFGFNGHSSYFPDGAFLKPFDKVLKPGDEIVINVNGPAPYKVGSKLLTDTENQWKVAGYMPLGSCKFMGEENVLSPALEACAGPVIWMWKQNFDGHRDLNMAIHSIHEEMPGTITRGQLLQTFIMPDVAHHGFAGRHIVRDYSVLNDLFRPAVMSFQWRLVGPDGKAAAKGAWQQKMAPGTTRLSALSLRLPRVAARTRYTLELRLHSDGRFVCGEDRDIDVWPDTPVAAGATARRIVLFDPSGKTAKALQSAGARFESAATFAPPPGDASACLLVIGEGALDESTARQAGVLSPFVENGGSVLVLAQSHLPQGLPVATAMETREWVSQPYVRMGSHPLLKDVTSWDLHFWAPDRVSARGAYVKPQGGAVVVLVDSGAENGLEWVQAMELYRGKGRYLLCQMPLVAAGDDEPMARELLARAIRCTAGAEGFLSPTRQLRLIGDKGGPVEKKMQDTGVDYELVAPDAGLDENRPTLLQAGAIPAAAQRAAWRSSLTGGATLVVSGARPEDAEWLSELAGTPVRVTVPRYRQWEGRGCRNGFDPLTVGLSHLDLFWKQTVFNANTTDNPEFVIEPLQDGSVEAEGGRELVFPGALVDIKTGRGRLIIDQRRWMSRHERLTRQTARNLSALALGLGVGVTPPPPPREWPANLAYRPIDITPYANRALADETAEDGKGGWSDQGPDADLRSFPTGGQNFRGVPFTIGTGPRSIIVLKSTSRPLGDDTPEEVTLPIGLPVEGLCFLHSSAFTGGKVALYQIQYADGTTCDIPLRGKENISDWTDRFPGEFANERGTKSYIAWTGSCKMFSPITVLVMHWVNPRPDVPVQAVRFAGADGGAVPILIGLTVAVKRDAGEVAQDQTKAQDLFKQAQAAKPDEAKKLLKQAIALTPDFAPAHQMLADLCEKDGREDEILEAYRQWTASNPRTPLPWNRLGQLLEKRRDYPGALEAYTQSLKIEWNQPPTIEAKTRMEKALNK